MTFSFHQIVFVEHKNMRPISGDVASKPDVATTQRYSTVVNLDYLKKSFKKSKQNIVELQNSILGVCWLEQ